MADDAFNPLTDYQGFEWDENKRRLNTQKHQIDFIDAALVFSDPAAFVVTSRISTAEQRYMIVGRIMHRTISVIFTRRGPLIRLISARAARRSERNRYDAGSREGGG